MHILSIDPGYDKVGYAVFETKGTGTRDFTFITSNLIKTSPKKKPEERLRQVYKTLDGIMEEYHIDTMVIEQLFFFKNKKTVIQVAQAIGVIELAAAMNNIHIERLTPLQIKETITGYGGADKLSVQKMIRMELGDTIQFKDDDESDAVACGLAYCLRINFL